MRDPSPPGQLPSSPAARNPPQGTHAKGTVPGPQTRTPAAKARGQRPGHPPKDEHPWEDGRPTSDTPHNGARHPPRECPSAIPTVRNAGSQERTLWGRCWVPTPRPPPSGKNPQQGLAAHPKDGRPGERERLTPDAPHNGEKSPLQGRPPATTAARNTPQGTARQRDSAGPPRPHTRAHSTWAVDPDCPLHGRAAGGGQAPYLRRPSQQREASPPRDALLPAPQRATPARKSARCGAGAGSPGPHQPRPGNTSNGTWLSAPKTGGRERESA